MDRININALLDGLGDGTSQFRGRYTKDYNYIDPIKEPQVSIIDKFEPGGQDVDGVVPLSTMLLEHWVLDEHFVQYTHPSGTRLLKTPGSGPGSESAYPGISFGIAAYDLDAAGHNVRPTDEDFVNLVGVCQILDSVPSPHIIYQTRGGARLLYLINPITNENQFEVHYQALQVKLANLIDVAADAGLCLHRLDRNVKDWTRLFRCPLVTRDNIEQFDFHIRLVKEVRSPSDLLELRTFNARKKPQPKLSGPPGGASFHTGDHGLVRHLEEIVEGSRNVALLKTCTYVFMKFKRSHAELVIQKYVIPRAISVGMDEAEIERVVENSRTYTATLATSKDSHVK